ncbi:MAG: hypothetical protein A2806_04415 [Candidatus Terrybacteria bacterium RIFCSPHIGHO2_01_FULL_48_17]|uniref:Glycosyl transferase family 1 domain-containing protein n=1 Tax=Candidatus Terrybacteria bacterium RIFCSPHIGHO2_01_FULL_48_17 TaxID=1802362 RepID=A0A1G2PME1_9BACT|nr:MAG: hypothetical protein A2806_04415 [Candidatus Terrybacteria bacterium RIFCSPHIGHO2_01_FULL_48_17]OHA52856.1 MAG: hypothetical protein A3A30_03100 [Candidatus Terrybacteria bacterium RIFCSPLOWO2_01_FULL_48_14]
MRIASIVTAAFPAPPPPSVVYAPIWMAMMINKGLAQRGHEVTFFTPNGSRLEGTTIVTAELEPFHKNYPQEPEIYQAEDIRHTEREKIINLWDQRLFAELYKMDRDKPFDVIHAHALDRGLPLGFVAKTPTIYTLHTPVYSWHEKAFGLFKDSPQYLVSISDAQRKPAQNLHWIETVYNGIDIEKFPFSQTPEDFFLFIGRINKDKGTAEAIEAARLCKQSLRIVGGQGKDDYWNTRIEPFLDGNQIRSEGLVPYSETVRFYQKARAVLIPIRWEEPFGLTMIEAMACGTPVIAFRRGSVPEVVKDGVTGFIVDTVEEMADAMKKIDQIDRRACRKHVEEYFTVEKMVDGYEQLFLDIINKKA